MTQKYQPLKKSTLLKPQEPHHSLSTSKTICKNPSQNFFFYLQPPRAKSSSQLQSGSRGAEKWFILPLSIQAPASPPELPGGAGAHHLWQRGAIHHGDRSHSPLFRQCEHLVTFRLLQAGNELESGPKKDTGWLIHTDFSLIKIILLVPNLQLATYEHYLKENTIEEPFRKQRRKPAPRWTHWYPALFHSLGSLDFSLHPEQQCQQERIETNLYPKQKWQQLSYKQVAWLDKNEFKPWACSIQWRF